MKREEEPAHGVPSPPPPEAQAPERSGKHLSQDPGAWVLSHLDSRCTGLVQRCSQGPKFPEFLPPPCLRFWGQPKLCKPSNGRIRARRGCFLSRLLQMGPQVNVQWETPDFSATIFYLFFHSNGNIRETNGAGEAFYMVIGCRL